jgi:stearoyl-CoA 9-desaturase NADPH oxidoreductase
MFTYPLRLSHYLELINPLWTKHSLQAKVVKVWDETKDSRTITLKPGRGWRNHRAGQHIRVGVAIEGMRHTRTYSISSAPNSKDGLITITVKAIPEGRASHYLVRKLKKGEYLPIGDPQGDFVIPDAIPVHPLFITAGSGITPIMSMLRNYSQEFRVLPDIQHIHYAPHAYDVIFGKELENLNKNQKNYNLNRIYTREFKGNDSGLQEANPNNIADKRSQNLHFHAEQLEALCPDWREREVWACGPATLLDAVEEHWEKAGLSRKLHTERFRAKLIDTPTDEISSGQIKFSKSNVDTNSDGVTNILRVAEDAGLNPKHGCRMGICHGCDCKLVSGSVRDLRTGVVTNEPGETIQICVSASIGNIEVEI